MSDTKRDITLCPNCGEPKSYGYMPEFAEIASDDSFAKRSWSCECGAYGDEYFAFDEDSWSIDES